MELDTTIQNQNPVETSQNQPPQGNVVNQKGFFLIIIGVIVLLLVVAGGAYYLGTQRNLSASLDTQNAIVASSPQPTKVEPNPSPSTNQYNKEEINGFPIYPGAIFARKETHEPCLPGGAGGFAICDTVTYTWKTSDDFDQVSSWYREDKSNSGWKCSGGAGSYDSARSAGGRTTCRNGALAYRLDLDATATITHITLVILTK